MRWGGGGGGGGVGEGVCLCIDDELEGGCSGATTAFLASTGAFYRDTQFESFGVPRLGCM